LRELIAPLQLRQKELLKRREFLQAELQKVLDESQHIDALVTQYTSEQPAPYDVEQQKIKSTPPTKPRKRDKISLTDILLMYLEEKQGQVIGYKDIAAAIRSVYAPEALSDGRIASAIRTLMKHNKIYKDETTRGTYQVPIYEEN
jgi:hypothetical protein